MVFVNIIGSAYYHGSPPSLRVLNVHAIHHIYFSAFGTTPEHSFQSTLGEESQTCFRRSATFLTSSIFMFSNTVFWLEQLSLLAF